MRFSEEPLPGQTASFLRPSACSALNILNKMCVNKFKIFPNFSKVRGQMSLGPVHSCIANYINKHWSENLCRNNEQLHRAVLKTSARCTAPVWAQDLIRLRRQQTRAKPLTGLKNHSRRVNNLIILAWQWRQAEPPGTQKNQRTRGNPDEPEDPEDPGGTRRTRRTRTAVWPHKHFLLVEPDHWNENNSKSYKCCKTELQTRSAFQRTREIKWTQMSSSLHIRFPFIQLQFQRRIYFIGEVTWPWAFRAVFKGWMI